MIAESRSDAQSCGDRAAEGVNEHVDWLILAFVKDIVNIVAVEVGTSDKAFKMKCVLSLWHVIVDLSATKLPLLYKGVKDAV